MAPTKLNPAAGDGWVRDCLARRLDNSQHSANRGDLQESAWIDELLARIQDRLQFGDLAEWERGFSRSILRQARAGGCKWTPSAKQLGIIEQIVGQPGNIEPLIEEEVDHDLIP